MSGSEHPPSGANIQQLFLMFNNLEQSFDCIPLRTSHHGVYRLRECVLCVTLDAGNELWHRDKRCDWRMAGFSPSVGHSPH